MTHTILYIHGMRGGADSRIPCILKDFFACQGGICSEVRDDLVIVVRTYDFDPEVAASQIDSWVEELKPELIIGESLGAVHAMRVAPQVPHLYVSPALNAPVALGWLSWISLIPFATPLLDWHYSKRPGDRQKCHFVFRTLWKYRWMRRDALAVAAQHPETVHHAFFGKHDAYRRSGLVCVRSWKRLFGPSSFEMYDGSHYMEEPFVYQMLIRAIVLQIEGEKHNFAIL